MTWSSGNVSWKTAKIYLGALSAGNPPLPESTVNLLNELRKRIIKGFILCEQRISLQFCKTGLMKAGSSSAEICRFSGNLFSYPERGSVGWYLFQTSKYPLVLILSSSL
jgi:hypothetical protein